MLSARLGFLLLLGSTAAHAQVQTLYIIEHSHSDVGFDAPPSVMDQRNHDRTVLALDLADSDPTYRWTVETTHQLYGFLDRATPADRARLVLRLTQGRFEYGANFTNVHSGLVGEEQYHRLTMPAMHATLDLGVAPTVAWLDDVPGFSLATPRVLANSGIPYAVLGPNDFVGGNPHIPLQDRPFWWEARDGSRVLTWMTWGSYIEGYFDWGLNTLQSMETYIPLRVGEFEAAGYPFDALLVSRASDDQMPNDAMANLVDQWNAVHTTPQLKLATATEFFEYLETTYGDVFPTYTGDAQGAWEDASAVTPYSASLVRSARSRLPDAEALWTILDVQGVNGYPAADIDRAWRTSLIFDEHSGGGVGWPGLLTQAEVEQENAEFVAYAQECSTLVSNTTDTAVAVVGPTLVPTGEAAIVLLNPLGAAFDDMVLVNVDATMPANLRLLDPAGGPDIPFRWVDPDRTKLAFHAEIPAGGWVRYEAAGGGNTPTHPLWAVGDRVSIGNKELVVSPVTGTATALTDSDAGLDWLASPDLRTLGSIEAEANIPIFFGVTEERNPTPVTVMVEGPSAIYRGVRVLNANGDLIRVFRLYEHEPRVDMAVVMRRSELPHVPFADHSDHYGVEIPANLTVPTQLLIDGPDGLYTPGAESLPLAPMTHFGYSTGACLNGAAGRWMCMSSPDTVIVDAGGMVGSNGTILATNETSITAKLIRHHDEGQVQGGAIVPINVEPGTPDAIPYRVRVRYGSGLASAPDREDFRWDLAPPLAAVVASGTGDVALPATGTLLDVTGPATVVALKKSEAGDGIVIRLRADAAGGTAVITPPFVPASADVVSLVEVPLSPLVAGPTISVPLTPEGVVTVLLRP